jgi:hypothetical protein
MSKLDIYLYIALALAGCHNCSGVYATSMSLPSALSDRLLVLGKTCVVVLTRVDWCAQYMICSGDRVDRVGQCWCIGCNLRMWNI